MELRGKGGRREMSVIHGRVLERVAAEERTDAGQFWKQDARNW